MSELVGVVIAVVISAIIVGVIGEARTLRRRLARAEEAIRDLHATARTHALLLDATPPVVGGGGVADLPGDLAPDAVVDTNWGAHSASFYPPESWRPWD